MQSHPAAPASPEPATTTRTSLPGFKDPPPGKRRVAPEPTPATAQPEHPEPTDAPQPSTHSPEEVENDPLVKTVLDVFGGEIKRVHPKNN